MVTMMFWSELVRVTTVVQILGSRRQDTTVLVSVRRISRRLVTT
ncbi:hypothetical protein Hanom_Chr06g00545351 [Helianthus anomalus]